MKFGTTFVATIALAALCSGLYLVAGTRAATAPPEQCDVPESFVESDTDLRIELPGQTRRRAVVAERTGRPLCLERL